MADISKEGLPVILRHLFNKDEALTELLVSAFLDQPLIPYGHHQDFAEGYGRLTEIVRRLGTFGTTVVFVPRDYDVELHDSP